MSELTEGLRKLPECPYGSEKIPTAPDRIAIDAIDAVCALYGEDSWFCEAARAGVVPTLGINILDTQSFCSQPRGEAQSISLSDLTNPVELAAKLWGNVKSLKWDEYCQCKKKDPPPPPPFTGGQCNFRYCIRYRVRVMTKVNPLTYEDRDYRICQAPGEPTFGLMDIYGPVSASYIDFTRGQNFNNDGTGRQGYGYMFQAGGKLYELLTGVYYNQYFQGAPAGSYSQELLSFQPEPFSSTSVDNCGDPPVDNPRPELPPPPPPPPPPPDAPPLPPPRACYCISQPGEPGPPGLPGPPGEKGDKGDKGDPGDRGSPNAWVAGEILLGATRNVLKIAEIAEGVFQMDLEFTEREKEPESLVAVFLGNYSRSQEVSLPLARGFRISFKQVPAWIGKRFESNPNTEQYIQLGDFSYIYEGISDSYTPSIPLVYLDNVYIIPDERKSTRIFVHTVSDSWDLYAIT